jgi:hypothetical protein
VDCGRAHNFHNADSLPATEFPGCKSLKEGRDNVCCQIEPSVLISLNRMQGGDTKVQYDETLCRWAKLADNVIFMGSAI